MHTMKQAQGTQKNSPKNRTLLTLGAAIHNIRSKCKSVVYIMPALASSFHYT